MSNRLKLATLGIYCALVSGSTPAGGADPIRLTGWEQVATLYSGGSAGRDSFVLETPVAGWPRNLLGRFDVRIVLPDGRVETQSLQVEAGQTPRRIQVFVPAAAIRNRRPESIVVRVSLVDPARNVEVSLPLLAKIDDFPHPRPEGAEVVSGPFGWGTPLAAGAGEARRLPRPGPEGLRFVRIPGTRLEPGFFIAATELSNAQVARLLPRYDPRANRSDEFLLEAPDQPAIGLTPKMAQDLLSQLSKVDPTKVAYGLPTVQDWKRAAQAGQSTTYWWGNQPGHPPGANFLGPEPNLTTDATAPTSPSARAESDTALSPFQPSPWQLFHTFGNVAEWATSTPDGRFVRMGGHFRSEPSEGAAEVTVEEMNSTGPDPYVGVRPRLELDEKVGSALALQALSVDPRLAKLRTHFDPDKAMVTVEGTLSEPAWRALADRRLAALWFVAAVENRIETPTMAVGQLARLGGLAGPVRRITPLGRWFYEVPLEVRWAGSLPVTGSEWWVNIYLPGGGHMSHRMSVSEPDRSRRLLVLIDHSRMSTLGLAPAVQVSVALSLGGEAVNSADPRVVSNVLPLPLSLK